MCRSDDSILGKRDRVAAGARQPLLGAALLEPAAAQRTAMIRTAGFASAAEIGLLLSTAEELRAANAGGKEPDSESTMYLQRGSLPVALKPLVERICAHVARVDADNWGVLAALQLPLPGDGVHGVNVRVAPFPRRKLRRRRSSLSAPRVRQVRSVELHEYSERGRKECATHTDFGSLFTCDILLSDTSDFEGGRMLAPTFAGSPPHTCFEDEQPFERGDALVFLSHKPHAVGAWRGGTRRTLVVELWDGPTCVGNHRCMGSSGEERGGSRRVLPQADGSAAVSEVEVAEHSQACLRWQRECYLGCWRGRAVSFHQQCLCQG